MTTTRIDFVPYPPTSFPFRDLLVLEQLPLGATDTVCEIGVGSGATTARLAKMCAGVTGFEISRATVEALRYLEDRHPNLKFVVADVTRKEDMAGYEGSFSRLISCDTLEHVSDPKAYFDAISRLLTPGGRFLVTFPNEPADKMHGITRFDVPAELEKLMQASGLEGRVGAANLGKRADRVAETLGWGPLRFARKVLKRRSYKRVDAEKETGQAAPQTFEETDFMKRMSTWKKLSPAINLYWYGVLKAMDARGPAFEIDWDFSRAPFTDCQVFVLGRKK
jgi:SAM-dependent methyltransferase